MAGLAHFGLGFAAKRLVPRVPLPVLLVVSWGSDLWWMIFMVLGLSDQRWTGYWSHGLFMCAVWAVVTALVTAIISRSFRTSLILGLLYLSHWVLDAVVWPMSAVFETTQRMPLLFEGSPEVGLGLYRSLVGVVIVEAGFIIGGVAVYIMTIRKIRGERRLSAPLPSP
jgi:hypothetical protein